MLLVRGYRPDIQAAAFQVSAVTKPGTAAAGSTQDPVVSRLDNDAAGEYRLSNCRLARHGCIIKQPYQARGLLPCAGLLW